MLFVNKEGSCYKDVDERNTARINDLLDKGFQAVEEPPAEASANGRNGKKAKAVEAPAEVEVSV